VGERDERIAPASPTNGDRPAGSSGAVGAVGIPPLRERELRCGAVAVVSGSGVRDLFHELGVVTIDGGPTLNPSTYDLLAGIHAVPAEEVIVLTNGDNVVMAAEQAARRSDKQVMVAHTRSQQAGLAAAVALAPERSMEENAAMLAEALGRVRTGAVAPAGRDDVQGRFRSGEAVGFVGEEVLAWGEPRETLRAVIAELVCPGEGAEPAELLSVLAGDQAPLPLAEVGGMLDGGLEVELRHGGQPAYWWLLTAE
jgi:dihydroxyacetone kinase-like predicted kinase